MKRIARDGAVLRVNEEELQSYLNKGWLEVDEKLKPINAPKKSATALEKDNKRLKAEIDKLKKENANLKSVKQGEQ